MEEEQKKKVKLDEKNESHEEKMICEECKRDLKGAGISYTQIDGKYYCLLTCAEGSTRESSLGAEHGGGAISF